jgi:hypothetical protein
VEGSGYGIICGTILKELKRTQRHPATVADIWDKILMPGQPTYKRGMLFF